MRETNSGEKTRVLVVGGTGSLGRRIVKECLAEGHETYVLQRPEIGCDIEKLHLLHSYKRLGAHLIEGSFSDHQSLVSAVKQVDIVVSAMSGVHFRTHNILVQLKLVEAIKEAGNVKMAISFVYAVNCKTSRQQLWEEITTLAQDQSVSAKPLAVLGDFNQILNPSEKSTVGYRITQGMSHFRDCVSDAGLFDITSRDKVYTWWNNQEQNPMKPPPLQIRI